jgi:hypothetical protein
MGNRQHKNRGLYQQKRDAGEQNHKKEERWLVA